MLNKHKNFLFHIMCGIIGVVSNEHSIIDILTEGLRELQNRGYDSIGFAFLRDDHTLTIRKGATKDIDGLLRGLGVGAACHNGIAHSRWATHGGITEANAHPHTSHDQMFCLVHNGIIENFRELRQTLPPDTPFLSETDTEVVVHLIAHAFRQQPEDLPLFERVCQSICATTKVLRGTHGLIVQCRMLPSHLFCVRYGSPLVVGISPTAVIVASEKNAFPPGTTKCFAVDDHDLVILQDDKHQPIRRFSGAQDVVFQDNTSVAPDDKEGCATWTEKEIRDQPTAIQMCIKNGSRILPDNTGVKLGGLTENQEKVNNTDHVMLLGCGTSYHACLLAAHYFRTMENRIQTTQVCDASEFTTSLIPRSGNTTMIAVSQSGETMDLLVAVRKFREARPGALVLGVVNVVDSVIARAVDGGVYTNSGRERGVASTKSFTTQVLALHMIACAFSRPCPITHSHLHIMRNLPLIVGHNLTRYFEEVRGWACALVLRFQNLFIVGKSFDHWVAMEAALKIKEISYIHAEAHSSSSLKHGPFALLSNEMLVVLLSNTPEERVKLENAYQEIRARHAPILVVSYENIHECPYYIHIPYHYFSYLEANMVMQVLALELSLAKGIHPDYPKNLAKVVTVE